MEIKADINGVAEVLLSITPDDSSYVLRELNGLNEAQVAFDLVQYTELPIGAYIEWRGERFTLCEPPKVTRKHSRLVSYQCIFSSAAKQMKKYKMRHVVQGEVIDARLTFSITAKPAEVLALIVGNLNLREHGWQVGEVMPDTEVVQSYSHTSVEDALQSLAKECDTEWEINGKTIHLRKVEYNRADPLQLSYGKGNGFLPNVGRANYTQSNPVEILYVQGGEQNIAADYGSTTLMLPQGASIDYDGAFFGDEQGFDQDNYRQYAVSADRMSIQRTDKELTHATEGSITIDTVYPKREGTVSEVLKTTDGFFDFTDLTIPASLNYRECTLPGRSLTCVFQSGMLTGKEFDVNYHHDGRRFAIVPATIDGVEMPSDLWKPATGDRYVVLNMKLPQAYVCDPATRTGAEWDMLREAVRHMYDTEDARFTFSGKLDPVYAAANWANIGGKLVCGGYVRFTDEGFERGTLVRITQVKEYICRPYSPEVSISNNAQSGSVSRALRQIEQQLPAQIDTTRRALQDFAYRGFRQVKETTDALQNAMLEGFDESISPLAVQTMQAMVGDESLQYVFVASPQGSTPITPAITFSAATRQLRISYYADDDVPFYLRHMTLGIATIATASTSMEYKQWTVRNFTSGTLDADGYYYLYVRAPHDTAQAAQWLLSTEAKPMDAEAGYYHLLVGILNSAAADGGRTFAPMYGYTEVLPGRITTDKIVSQDGCTYFDLVRGEIGGNITFRGTADYNELSQGVSAATSTANSANSTANSAAAAAAAAQSDIDALAPNVITEVDVEYASGSSATVAPATGWNTSAPAWEAGKYIWQRTRTTYGDGTSDTSAPTCIQGAKGADGTNGTNGRDGTNGTNGTNGTDGKGITSIKEQYYLSTSSTAQSGGSWQDTQPAWAAGKYLWTRSYIKWTAGADSTTTPVLADALNKANSTAATAQSTANTANSTANTANSTANAAKTKIDSLQVGGRNMVRNSQGNDVTDWVYSGTLMDDDHFGSCVSKTVTTGEGYLAPPRIYGFEPSAKYTLTAWIKPNDEFRELRLYLLSDRIDNKRTGSGYVDVAQAPSITTFTRNQWQLVQSTFTTRADIYSGYLRFTNGGPITAGASAELRLCRIKLERGNIATDWTPAPEDVQQQVSDLDYLKNTFSEGTTDISGGVVLSSFLGVKEGDAVVAGMQASADTALPMIFAGAPSAKQTTDAKFIVKKNGHVQMRDVNIISDSGGEAVAVEAGAIKIGSLIGGQVPQPTMIISSEQKNTVAEMIQQSSAGTDTGSVTSAARTLSKTNSQSQMIQTASETLTLWTKQVPQAVTGGTYQLTPCASFIATLTGDTGNKGESEISASVSYVVKVNGAIAYTLGSGSRHRLLRADGTWESSSDFPITMAAQPILVQVKPGDTLAIERTLSVTSARFTFPPPAGEAMLLTVPTTATLTMPAKDPLVSYTNAVTVWNNRYYGNGLFLSSASNQYLGISSAATDNVLMQWRHGDGWLRYQKNAGLLWKQTNDANAPFFRVNPLVMVVRLRFTNNTYTADAKYNPLNKSVSVTTNGQGNVTLTHNLACANLTFTGSGCNGQRAYIDFLVVNSNKATIKIGNDASPDSFDVDVLIYDYGSY